MTGSNLAPDAANIPQFSSRYELQAKLGVGGMGAVYKARDKVLKKIVAVKLLLPSLNTDAVIRFQKEARFAAKLEHPNILKVLDFGQTDKGDLYLVMDYIDGISLDSRIKNSGPLDLDSAVDIFRQICLGLQHAHSQHILHRDIKPSNVMLCRDETGATLVKIVDFGLAKLDADDQKVTATGVRVGSPLYMSPEQAQGLDVDLRSDIYSMGCLMFFCLCGRPPLKGETYLETIMKQAEEDAPKLNDQFETPKYPPQLEYIVEKSLRKDPSRRFQTADDLMHALLAMKEEVTYAAPSLVSTLANRARDISTRTLLLLIVFVFVGPALVVLSTYKLVPQNESKFASNATFKEHYIESHPWIIASGNLHSSSIKKLVNFLGFDQEKTRVILQDPKLSNSDIKYLTKLPLLALDVSGTKIGDNGLVTISRISTLQSLIANDNRNISDNGLEVLDSDAGVRVVALRNTNVTDAGVAQLCKNKSLLSLDVSDNKAITRKSLETLIQGSHVLGLRIGGTSITGSDLKLLSQMPQLLRLSVSDLNLTDDDLQTLSKLPIQRLDISYNSAITDKGLKLFDLERFGTLNVQGCPKVSKALIDSMMGKHKDMQIFSNFRPYKSSMDTELAETWRADRGRDYYDPECMLWAGSFGGPSDPPRKTDQKKMLFDDGIVVDTTSEMSK